MPTPKQRYARALRDIAKRYGALDDRTVRRLIELLQQVRRELSSDLAAGPSESQYRLRQLRASVDRLMSQFEGQLAADLRASVAQAYNLGQAGVTEPLQAIGVRGAFNQVNPAQLNITLDFSAELARGISVDLRHRIDTQLRLAVLGQTEPFETMKAITRALGLKARDGVWGRRRRPEVVRGVAARAETIVRTEMARIFNLAHHSQQAATAQTVPDLRKTWIATGDHRTRISHLRAHARYRDNPIPVNEPFAVGGALLMYPGDPAGPASETINCRCTSTTVHPEIGVIVAPVDRFVTEELRNRNERKRTAA